MKVECVQNKLTGALTKAEKIAGKHITLPILKCFLMEARDSILTIRTTNLDLGIEISIPAKVVTEGIVAVPADILRTFVAGLSGENKITLEHNENILVVTTDHTVTRIKTENHEEFPSIPKVDSTTSFLISSKNLTSGIRSVMYSASPSSMKPELASLYIYKEGNSLMFVATDSFRLAEKKVAIKGLPDFESLLIPYKNVSDIVKVIDDISGEITVHISENQVAFVAEDIYITSRIIDGVFPDYRQIIPKEFSTEAIVLKQDLTNTLKISNIFSDKFNQVTISVDPDDKHFSIETQNADVGESVNYVDAAITGDALSMSFNHRYVSDSLQALTPDSVSLQFSLGKPLVMKGIGDGSFLYLVMPINK